VGELLARVMLPEVSEVPDLAAVHGKLAYILTS
jgi:hypothetical protein